MHALIRSLLAVLIVAGTPFLAAAAEKNGDAEEAKEETYSESEILEKATGFFGETTQGLAKAVEKVFSDQGRPNAYIAGEEVSGAIGVGVRYGQGTLNRKVGGSRKVYWQGPSVGFDFGGNAAKVFVLVYDLEDTESLFRRFPGVEGSYYFIAGVGVNYLQSGDTVLAPMRTGVGLRAGVNVGYMHITKKKSWIPF